MHRARTSRSRAPCKAHRQRTRQPLLLRARASRVARKRHGGRGGTRADRAEPLGRLAVEDLDEDVRILLRGSRRAKVGHEEVDLAVTDAVEDGVELVEAGRAATLPTPSSSAPTPRSSVDRLHRWSALEAANVRVPFILRRFHRLTPDLVRGHGA